MKQLLFQVLLIVGVVTVAWRLLAGSGQRTQALRRIGLLAFLLLAVGSILRPGTLTEVAKFFGIGRGADLVFYCLVIAFLGFVVTTFKRFRAMETRYTRLARRIALDEARPAAAHAEQVTRGPVDARVDASAAAPVGAPVDARLDTPDAAPVADAAAASTANPATLSVTPPSPSTRAADAD
ncbi:DUF2304 domain-containing protein [Intrasporangium flavum]|uniref:DUF2304 domain-containing protein n=1 Tax=Intrasporangium flavum TaxID=1428657 RepID=UPI00096FC3E5|nr:DUF2304 domain-containing protein [Intrasporangium flavum]